MTLRMDDPWGAFPDALNRIAGTPPPEGDSTNLLFPQSESAAAEKSVAA